MSSLPENVPGTIDTPQSDADSLKSNEDGTIDAGKKQKRKESLSASAASKGADKRSKSGSQSKKFSCKICDKHFTTKQAAIRHKKEQHEKNVNVKCELCEMVFKFFPGNNDLLIVNNNASFIAVGKNFLCFRA
ncbi:PR domain zinc finger protein 5-like [Contarinia nasturtii]|uniref:PR domain zinc finger protein 5-like n=1 Tax=Contarinia nasturtii TaxID=265458 RepID=UPI0012D45126|nr:PR domain zinc finger protein 5-like [Contarinia nasturtii]